MISAVRRLEDDPAKCTTTHTAKIALLTWDLKRQSCTVEFTCGRFADLSKAAMDLLNDATYL